MLIGHFNHTFDDKKRISIPAKWRTTLGKKVVITSGLDKSLFIFSMKEWTQIAEKISSLSFTNIESRKFGRFMLANAFDTDIDSVGRILINDSLRNFADLNSKVVLVGMYNRLEVWDEEIWNKYSSQNNKDADSIANKLSEIGIL